MNKRIIELILDDARFGWRPLPGDVRGLLSDHQETQAQAAYRIGVNPRTIRRAASQSDPYRLNAHAWALLRLAYLLEGGGAPGDETAQARVEIDRLRAERDDHEQACTALEEVVGQLKAEADELREALAAVVACWDGPKYKHFMGPRIDTARAILAQHHNTGDDQWGLR